MLTTDFVMETCLIAIFSNHLPDPIHLKGGQALRIKEKITNRFSADMDFSNPSKIEDPDFFFSTLEKVLKSEFEGHAFHLFDFKWVKKPKMKKPETPDFWSGWAVEFKLIEPKKKNLSIEQKRREALVLQNADSSKVYLDISEHEYCDSVEIIRLQDTKISVYSRPMLVVEKLRAICQQHPDYPYKDFSQRCRDFYDIERLWNKELKNPQPFLKECARLIPEIFSTKATPIELIDKIFEQSFIDEQKSAWGTVESSVQGALQPFDYYVQSLLTLVQEIKKYMRK